ncbi:MAG TPA: dTDP-4-dehydrorhamnose 3,5-epimerase [Phnomibacter sp.]|nr:dTDP-4-dehydrorhamnose 3,5-epimerase [Phnomibacter sp.]
MEILSTPLKDCWLIKNTIFPDERGYFFESFNHKKFSALTGWEGTFVQDNQSSSSYGVVRGLHFQMGEYAQAKLVRVLQGKVLDVAIDLRPDSPTFGKSFAVELTESNEFQLFVPRGFAHGFSVLSEQATFFYKCDNYYHKAAENGIHPLDADLNVDWQIGADQAKLSGKDQAAQSFKQYLASL